MLKNYLLILLTIAISITAQTLLKSGMKQIGEVASLNFAIVLPLVFRIATNIFIIAGLSLYVVGTFFWLILLSRLDLSFLYPFGALQYMFIFAISYFFLHETIRPARIVGALVILAGIYIISKFG